MKGDIPWPKDVVTWSEGDVCYITIPFTWTLSHAYEIILYYTHVRKWVVGGPAVMLMPGFFHRLKHVKEGTHHDGVLQRVYPEATRTTVGCIRKCAFCGVPRIEGDLQELEDWPDLPILCDNNLLAASKKHFDRVIDRLVKWERADFNQGLDARLLTKHHAKRFAEIKDPVIRLSLDTSKETDAWERAYNRLRDAGIRKKDIRTYVLVGWHDDPYDAWERCEFVTSHGIMALPQWFHSLTEVGHNRVTAKQEARGWTNDDRLGLMGYYYQHRFCGEVPAGIRFKKHLRMPSEVRKKKKS